MKINKKSISVVVVSILLVIVSTVSTMAFFNWSNSYSTDLLGEASNKKKLVGETRIIRVLKDNLYLYSGYENIKINKVSIEGEECIITSDSNNPNNEFTRGSIKIDFEDCTDTLTDKTNEILIETDKGVIIRKVEIAGIESSNSGNSNSGGGSNNGGSGSNNDCSSGSINYTGISFSHSSLNNLETKTLEEDESISNGTIKHNIDVVCQNSVVSSDSSTYKKETICDGGFEAVGDSCENYQRYEVLDDTLIDHDLGLEWQRTNYPNSMNWTDAVSYCDNLTHSIYDDWRLPEKTELESLIDKSVSSSPYIIGQYTYFPEIRKSYYWTSTKLSSSNAYLVYFGFGSSGYSGTSRSDYALCVRNS